MQQLSTEQALRLLSNPLINFSEVARQFYADQQVSGAEQALRRRIYGVQQISEATLDRLTEVFRPLCESINQ